MPINTDLNIAPYFDDFDAEDQFYRILFKPGYALQARELTQLQTMLQNQIETFGDNIFKEGSIIKGCNFAQINGLQYVKLADKGGFDPREYISRQALDTVGGVDNVEVELVYEIEGSDSGLKARIVEASRGFSTRPPDLNTFYIQYINNTEVNTQFRSGELLTITERRFSGEDEYSTTLNLNTINVTTQSPRVGYSYGIQSTPGIIFQKGQFIYAEAQSLIVEKYSDSPDDKAVGYKITETLVTALQDRSLYDNAAGTTNANAPGADRLKLEPVLTVLDISDAEIDLDFFTLIKYNEGKEVTLRDVSQYNVLGDEMARRTYEESGDYIIEKFNVRTERKASANNALKAIVGPGLAYIHGYRIENGGEIDFTIEDIEATETYNNQSVSMQYGHYIDVTSSFTGHPTLNLEEVNLLDSGLVTRGTAIVRNITPSKIYLTAVKMNGGQAFNDVNYISANGDITIPSDSVIRDQAKAPVIFPTGVFSTKDTTDISVPVRSKFSGSFGGTTISITQGGSSGRDFACDNDDIVVIDSAGTQLTVTGYSTSLNNSVLNITLGSSGTGYANVFYNERIQSITPFIKTPVEPYIKVAYASGTTRYSLGFPDVISIQSIVDSSGTDFTKSFRLKQNQKDHYYDISYMEYIPNRPEPTGTLTIKLKVHQIGSSQSGGYFFTISSYKIDDDSTTLPSGFIRSNDISVYQSSSGKKYNLRESVDFRPYVDKDAAADYTALTAGAAPTISTAVDAYTISFTDHASYGRSNAAGYLIPALNESMVMDIESYLARVDLITVDSYGRFSLIKGQEDQSPRPPTIGDDQFIISQLTIPGYPALSQKEAAQQKKNQYAVRATTSGVRRYTMADIADIDRRSKSLEYYISLNALEQSVENMIIRDGVVNRFKNGYIADPLNDLTLANMESPEFSASILPDRRVMAPALKTYPLDMKYKTSSNATIFPATATAETATLSRNAHVAVIKQPFATGTRSCTTNFYSYRGQGQLFPDHDFVHDTVTDPVPVLANIPNQMDAFVDDIQEFLPQTQTSTQNIGSVQVGSSDDFFPGFIEQTTVTETTVGWRTEQQNVGDFVSNIQFNPYIRGRKVRIYMTGLRPNTRHYFYFDGEDVNAYVTPGDPDASIPRDIYTYGQRGDAVTTDDNGILRALFDIPAGTFFVGDRILHVADVDAYDDIQTAAVSQGFITYHAYNIDISSRSLTMSTRIPELQVNTSTTTRNVQGRARPQQPEPADSSNDSNNGNNGVVGGGGGGGGGVIAAIALAFVFFDPLAQTFYVKEGMGKGSGTIYASKIDVFFKRKSLVNGITLQIREVLNGYPTNKVIPFSKVHKLPGAVSVSDDASVATTFEFKNPIKLKTDREYAIVLVPDANDPDYLAFTSKIGGTDLTPGDTQGKAVIQDWGDGVLFTSTNNKAWKSYQDEDLKFTLYRHEFNQNSGSVTLTNQDHEFFTLTGYDDNVFEQGELVYQEKALQGNTSATVSILNGSNSLTGTDLDETFAVGDWIKVTTSGAGRKELFEVIEIVSDSEITLDHKIDFEVASGSAVPIVSGECVQHNPNKPETLILKNSSATATRGFSANTIIGYSSGTSCQISSVDNVNLGFVQPLIQKVNDITTTTKLEGRFTNPSDVLTPYAVPMKFADSNYFTQNGVLIYSKTNDPTGNKPFEVKVTLDNRANSTSSPMVDIETASLIAYEYQVTNDANTAPEFITKTVELADDIDAEDMRVFIQAYRPASTDIKVYIKAQNPTDRTSFDTVPWIEMELVDGIGQYSSDSNLEDFREYAFEVPEVSPGENGINAGGVLEYTNAEGSTYTEYRKFALKFEMLSPYKHKVPTIKNYRGIAIS